jgi:hypothetical protein
MSMSFQVINSGDTGRLPGLGAIPVQDDPRLRFADSRYEERRSEPVFDLDQKGFGPPMLSHRCRV